MESNATVEANRAQLVVGLGNPGTKYANTRHNVGFMVADELLRKADAVSLAAWQPSNGILYKAISNGITFAVLKPMTFMNSSGLAVGETIQQLGISPQKLLVVSDDLDMELGRIRLRLKGSSGGHRGIGSIADVLGTVDFPRLRTGIGRPQPNSLTIIEYVLSSWTSDEAAAASTAVQQAALMAIQSVTIALTASSWKLEEGNEATSDNVQCREKQGEPEVEKL